MAKDIDLDSLLEYIDEPEIKLYRSLKGITLELYAGSGDKVVNGYFDKETDTFHLTLDFYQGARADLLERIYHARIPTNTTAIVVDEVIYTKPSFSPQERNIPDFTDES